MESISFLIPVYNTDKMLLKSCFGSVLECFRGGDEIIVVDDGSGSELTINTLRELVESHPQQVKIIHQKNCGQFPARWKALSLAINEYVMFVDSDDELNPKGIRDVRQSLSVFKPDLLTFDMSLADTDSNKEIECRRSFGLKSGAIPTQELYDAFFTKKIHDGLVGKIFKKTVLNHVDSNIPSTMRLGEDRVMYCRMLPFVKTIVNVPSCGYIYKLNALSTTRNFKASFIDDYIYMYEQDIKVINILCPKLLPDYQLTRAPTFDIVLFTYLAARSKQGFEMIRSNIMKSSLYSAVKYKRKKHRYGFRNGLIVSLFIAGSYYPLHWALSFKKKRKQANAVETKESLK